MITDNDVDAFIKQMLRFHHGILFDEWDGDDRESLGYVIEGMTNINSKEELAAFFKMCTCYKVDF